MFCFLEHLEREKRKRSEQRKRQEPEKLAFVQTKISYFLNPFSKLLTTKKLNSVQAKTERNL